MKKLAGSKKIQKHKSAKSTPKASSPSTKKLMRPKKNQNFGKVPKPTADEMYEIDFEGSRPIQTQRPKDSELAMTNDTEVQSSPVPPTSLKRIVKGKKKALKAASGKKNNATTREEHNAVDANEYDAADAEENNTGDAEENNTGDAEEHNAADSEEQVVDGSDLGTNEVNADLADHTVVIADGSTRSTEKPLPTPATKQLNRKFRGHVTKKARRISPRVRLDKILLSYMPVEDLWLGDAIELFSKSLKINWQIEQSLPKQQTWSNVQGKDKTRKSLDECLIELRKQREVLDEGIAHLNNFRVMDEKVTQQMEDVV